VKPLDFPLLTDENISPNVVEGLRARGCNLRTVAEEHLIGRPDAEVLDRATSQRRVVVTHDLGFGRSAGATFVGIVYLRPGHISAAFVLGVIDALKQNQRFEEPKQLTVEELIAQLPVADVVEFEQAPRPVSLAAPPGAPTNVRITP
jgi:predicted nuclease of predicted toxin-antitoxin system